MNKIKPTFALRKKDSGDTFGIVYAFINFTLVKGESKKVCFSMKNLTTGKPFKVPVEAWDKAHNCCKIKGSVVEKEYYQTINAQIKEIEVAVKQIVTECEAKHCSVSTLILSEDNIYSKIHHIESFTVSPEPTKDNRLVPYWKSFIEKAKNGEVNHNGKPYKPTAIKNHQKVLNAFVAFEKSQQHKYTFDEIDAHFYDVFVAKMREANKHSNTIAEAIKNLKAIMKRASDDGLHLNTKYKKFSIPWEEVDTIYLTENELEQLYQYKFFDEPSTLDKYRDLFLVGCYTGLRWEDYRAIQKDNFKKSSKGYPELVIRTSKTNTLVYIPFIWRHLKDILEKYDYKLPKVSPPKFNENIKSACREAGINEKVIITAGRHKRDEPYEKWELVSSHTARRSACTNMVLRGIKPIYVMRISGHKRESTFLKYIRVTGEQIADMIAENYADKD